MFLLKQYIKEKVGIKLKKYNIDTKKSENATKLNKTIRIFDKNKPKFAKYMFIFSKSKDGKKWLNDDKTPVNFGVLKTVKDLFTARALVMGKYKFSLVIAK